MSTTKTYPVFQGDTWSYDDAKRRVPSAWRAKPKSTFPKHEYAPGHPESVNNWRVVGTVEVDNGHDDVAPKGLGHFERSPTGKSWIYIRPNGYAQPVHENYGKDEPPPLPRPEAQRETARCSCGPHYCSACGTPHWIEFHGVADGKCTYCYASG